MSNDLLVARRFDARVLGGIGVLVAVVEAGSFVKAASALGITQSGVSRAIARLEVRVGVRLLQRTPRAVVLTEEGRRFHADVVPHLAGIEDAALAVTAASTSPRGRLRVAVDGLVARLLIGPRIDRFLARHPDIALELVVRDTHGDLVAEGFDAAVRFGEPEPSALITRKLLDARVVTCASTAYLARHGRPKDPTELVNHECILYRSPVTGRPFEWIFQKGKKVLAVKVTGRLTVNESATQLAACRAGFGIAQPLAFELAATKDHGLVDLFPAWSDERFPLHVSYPSRRLPPAKVRALVDFVVSAMRDRGAS